MTIAFRRRAERRNKMVRWPLSSTEKSTKLASFRFIVPLCENALRPQTPENFR
jgi:hypothetical protein